VESGHRTFRCRRASKYWNSSQADPFRCSHRATTARSHSRQVIVGGHRIGQSSPNGSPRRRTSSSARMKPFRWRGTCIRRILRSPPAWRKPGQTLECWVFPIGSLPRSPGLPLAPPACRSDHARKTSPQAIKEGIKRERKFGEIDCRAQRRIRRHNAAGRTGLLPPAVAAPPCQIAMYNL
jgi:hypothetical protein